MLVIHVSCMRRHYHAFRRCHRVDLPRPTPPAVSTTLRTLPLHDTHTASMPVLVVCISCMCQNSSLTVDNAVATCIKPPHLTFPPPLCACPGTRPICRAPHVLVIWVSCQLPPLSHQNRPSPAAVSTTLVCLPRHKTHIFRVLKSGPVRSFSHFGGDRNPTGCLILPIWVQPDRNRGSAVAHSCTRSSNLV
jgi:hypothetical protein